jgi:hypothetical protein
MQINLNQPEIVKALRQYIVQQGIALGNKVVGMSFTAGRKETGISVEINISDDELPDLGPTLAPVLSLVTTPAAAEEPVPVSAEAPAVEAAEPKSLFG